MTTALAIIGCITVILGAATKIPAAVCALIRACIPMIAAFNDLHHAIRHLTNKVDNAGNGS